MRPTKLLIFGSPEAGTPLMLAAPSVAIDLPLKILVWQDDQGKVWVSFNSPEYLKDTARPATGCAAKSIRYRNAGDEGSGVGREEFAEFFLG